MTAGAVVTDQDATHRRVRASAWFGAVVLLVLCALAAVPSRTILGGEPVRSAHHEDRGVRVAPSQAPRVGDVPVAAGRRACRVVRTLPRCRSRREGGLPPVRAPTA